MQAIAPKSFTGKSASVLGMLASLLVTCASLWPSAAQAFVPHWYRTCRATPSGQSCDATACAAGQYVQCSSGSCSCASGGWTPDHDGSKYCAWDEHVECSDRGTGFGCYCARGDQPLMPQKALPAYPLEVVITSGSTDINSFARFDDGSVWGWGAGAIFGSDTDYLKPHRMMKLSSKATKLTAGTSAVCTLMQDQTVQCWGDFGSFQWPEPHTIESVPGVTLTNLIGLTQGANHACAWRADGHVFCWGQSSFRRFADASCTDTEEAFAVTAVTDAAQAVASDVNTCFLRKNGHVACVGLSHVGQLGTGEIDHPEIIPDKNTCVKSIPFGNSCAGTAVATDIPGLKNVLTLSGGSTGSFCAETSGGTFCWGANDYSRLALSTSSTASNCIAAAATPIKRPEGPFHVFGPNNTCVWTPRGVAQCWGAHGAGVLLDDTTKATSGTPQLLPFAQNITSLAIGTEHACYAGEGVIRCWGHNDHGQLGNGTSASLSAMVSVEDFTINTPSDPGGAVSSFMVSGQNSVGAGCSLYDTGIDVAGGHKFTVSATGTWSLGPGAQYVCSATGTTAWGQYLGFNYGTLIGRVGTSGSYFNIGASSTQSLTWGGRLYLGTVDSDCANNGGALNVTVTR
jgi:alpha-tubulin suppressor-like RCC1 family protein